MLINIILFLGINLVKKYKKNRFHYPKSGMFGLWLNGLLFSKVTWWSKMSDFDEKIIRGRLKDEIENIKTLDDLIGLLSIIEESEKKWKSKFNKFWYDKMLFHIYEEKFDKITIESFFDLIKELDRKTNGV
ncbi:hypothetical protein MARTH_orf593 [Metamycoplasma arthritidis 158L3-1]|uniref:Uncharacterized protein n=3 Tax=Metamycoplasma arthritidis TaxID=2111 RepID=B3PMY5_META1|nr:hypothetical protein MARTH_orf593 [Metamycoplasma arthritidis 158L3-1]